MPTEPTREQRFDQYVALRAEAVGQADRATPLRDSCTGLLLPIEGKSMEPMAAAVAPATTQAKHQSLQQFISDAPWRDEPVLAVARPDALLALGAHGGVEATIVDETGLPKQGRHWVGGQRHYGGQLGKVCNCQVAGSLALANWWASVPLTWELYRPQAWAEDEARRKKAGVPEEIEFRTNPQRALAQIKAAARRRSGVGRDCGRGGVRG
jgi:SRSO17 transposase